MSRPQQAGPVTSGPKRATRIRLASAAAGVGVALTLVGCSAGMYTQTSSQVAAVNGGAGDLGPISLREVQLAYPEETNGFYPAGTDAPVLVAIANSGATGDRLVSVSSTFASTATVDGSTEIAGGFSISSLPTAKPGQVPTRTGTPTTSSSGAAATSSQGHGSGDHSGHGSSTGAPTSSSASVTSTTGTSATSGSAVSSTSGAAKSSSSRPSGEPGRVKITLKGLAEDVRPGKTIPVVFVFQSGGRVTVDVPIANPEWVRPDEPKSGGHGDEKNAGGGH